MSANTELDILVGLTMAVAAGGIVVIIYLLPCCFRSYYTKKSGI
jgi:hypothetical protein